MTDLESVTCEAPVIVMSGKVKFLRNGAVSLVFSRGNDENIHIKNYTVESIVDLESGNLLFGSSELNSDEGFENLSGLPEGYQIQMIRDSKLSGINKGTLYLDFFYNDSRAHTKKSYPSSFFHSIFTSKDEGHEKYGKGKINKD